MLYKKKKKNKSFILIVYCSVNIVYTIRPLYKSRHLNTTDFAISFLKL